ncbi:MAG: propane 2-monooxygenase small subunit [Actinomycetota bacterium]|jgi:hypothetical protein|nr:propane 2-monooxygenase small subunit [Actinomycetota bacterium]MDQ1501234.1 propane 2-monooxygenase small subunit [Actinomycetota bacterium]MDQ1506573.1 propane 2-monooxygenase small subunit [Actinomycetota bacterium]
MSEKGPFDGPRDFFYITPMGRRLSEYEALNQYILPLETSMDHPVAKRAGWPADSTALRSENWYAFRDPAQRWQRPYIKRQAEQERGLERALASARDAGRLSRMPAEWAEGVIGDVYVPAAFFERGLSRALMHAAGIALSDMVMLTLILNSSDKERHAQDIVFYHYDLAEAGVPVGADVRLSRWLEDPALQGLRALVEHINATSDWAEVALVVNLLVEPLLSRFLFNELLWQAAAAHRDVTTPAILGEAENDRQLNIAAMVSFASLVLDDETHGEHNRGLVEGWLTSWYPEIVAAMETLAPVAERVGVDTGEARSTVEAAWRSLLAGSSLGVPAGVN